MAGSKISLPTTPHLIGPSRFPAVKNFRQRFLVGAPFTVRISGNSQLATSFDPNRSGGVVSEGPSCIFVGPIETASQETLEALYRQARDAYYSGTPLIVDDMFDRVELKLRWYGSKYAVKYPRCSLRRQSTYADAQEDPSQVIALASVWFLILVFGGSVCLLPVLYTVSLAYQDTFNSEAFDVIGRPSAMKFLDMLNSVLFMMLGSVVGCPVASASARALGHLWRNDLVALKGACPNCGEEVFAFVRSDQSNSLPHRSNCHVCECLLEFRTKSEQKISKLGRRWIHGRVYLISEKRSRQHRIQP